MDKTVTCLFNSEAEATSTLRQLENSGISQGDICLFSNTGNNRSWEGTSSFDESAGGAGDDRVERYLRNNGVPADDAHAYAEGVRRGHTLIAVRCGDDRVDEVVRILDNDAVLDLDERQESWRSEGWPGYSVGSMGAADSATTSATGITSGSRHAQGALGDRSDLQGRDEVIPVAEEELHVGKRDVSHGRVRIRSHVVERPVQEQVSLTEEHVDVERRPVDGSMRTSAAGGDDLFRERTIEMEERGEKAVISKEARVVEEVVARKETDRHTETISDTVRKTEVEVDDERSNPASKTGTTDGNR